MPLSAFIILGIQILFVAIIDFRTKKISNIWPIINLIVFIFLAVFFRNSFHLSLEHFLIPLGVLVVGFALFLVRVMGPGDTKYLFSLFLLVPFKDQKVLFFCLIYVTILVGSILLLLHAIQNFGKIKLALKSASWGPLKGVLGTKFTFAPLIFMAWIWYGWKIGIYSF